MARESKRRRAERRFGRPDRLADRMLHMPLVGGDVFEAEADAFRHRVVRAPVVVADNVADYVAAQPEKFWTITDIPGCRLPFPDVFIEAKATEGLRGAFDRTGILFTIADPARLLDSLADGTLLNLPDNTTINDDLPMLRERCKHLLDFGVVLGSDLSTRREFLLFALRGSVFLDGDYAPLRGPLAQVEMDLPISPKSMSMLVRSGLYTALLAIAFINCKNVALTPVEPDPALNRVRRNAGLKPFLRYHTIDIEPMKTVLRTEGGIEANGLKKALHICRGHLIRFTEERPMFGRPGLFGTFWVPDHVRGSAKRGVIVSDYRVHPPRPPGDPADAH